MDVFDASNSESESVSKNDMVSKAKGKKKQNTPKQIERTIRSDHFQETDKPNMVEYMYCQDRIVCARKSGTINIPCTHHIHACKQYPPNVDPRQNMFDLQPKTHISDEGSNETVAIPRLPNQKALEKSLAKMFLIDKRPLSFVEGEGFREYCRVVNPHFVIPSRSKLATLIMEETTDETSGNA